MKCTFKENKTYFLVKAYLLDGQSHISKVEEGGDPAAGIHRPSVLEPVDPHGLIAHGFEPGLEVGEPSLPHVHLVLDRGLELGRGGGVHLGLRPEGTVVVLGNCVMGSGGFKVWLYFEDKNSQWMTERLVFLERRSSSIHW